LVGVCPGFTVVLERVTYTVGVGADTLVVTVTGSFDDAIGSADGAGCTCLEGVGNGMRPRSMEDCAPVTVGSTLAVDVGIATGVVEVVV